MIFGALIIGFFFLVPLLNLIGSIFRKLAQMGGRSVRLVAPASCRGSLPVFILAGFEYAWHPLRAFIGWIVWVVLLVWSLKSSWQGSSFGVFFYPGLLLFFLCLAHHQKTKALLLLAELLRAHPVMHSRDFFALVRRFLAFGAEDYSVATGFSELYPETADLRGDVRIHQTSARIFLGVLDTVALTRMVLVCSRYVGTHYACEVGDRATVMWGKRLLELARGALHISGIERLQNRDGRFLLLFNHKSSMDFVLAFFALSGVRLAERPLRPRYIVAKDHFHDNPLLYSFLGVGRAIEIMGMVFIERKNSEKGFQNLHDAAEILAAGDTDIALYPQGTRAVGNYDRAGKRRDAGYYTTISKKNPTESLSHFKKGSGYLIYETLQVLKTKGQSEPLNLVFVGIHGTANILPRGNFKVQTGAEVHFHIGDVVRLTPEMFDDNLFLPDTDVEKIKTFAKRMNVMIDEKLKLAMDLHPILKKRFVTDLRGAFRLEPEKLEAISTAMDRVSVQNTLYQIIDRVYALPVNDWNGYLSQLTQLLQGRAEMERYETMLAEVSEQLIGGKKVRSH